jgi:tetratricopeptide (TPR) repeat protein
MKKITFTLIFAFSAFGFAANAQNTNELQKQLDTAQNVCVKLDLYTLIAADLIQFDQPKTHEITYAQAGKAVDYVLKAIHINSQDGDYYAVRNNFDVLSQAYFIQKKYTQAKWFNLQSNNISRDLRDVPRIIYSLQQMAVIKSVIKDYKLAHQDLDEAMILAKNTYNLILQIEIERGMAALYDREGNVKQAIATQKHYSMLAANLKKAQTPSWVLAAQKAQAKVKKQTIANLAVKKTSIQSSAPLESKLNIENGIWVVKD